MGTMVPPYVSRLADHIHSKGAYLSLHSCGEIEKFVPCMKEAGADEFSIYFAARSNRPLMTEALCVLLRKRLCGSI